MLAREDLDKKWLYMHGQEEFGRHLINITKNSYYKGIKLNHTGDWSWPRTSPEEAKRLQDEGLEEFMHDILKMGNPMMPLKFEKFPEPEDCLTCLNEGDYVVCFHNKYAMYFEDEDDTMDDLRVMWELTLENGSLCGNCLSLIKLTLNYGIGTVYSHL